MSEVPSGWAETSLGDTCHPSQYGWTTSAIDEGGRLHFLRTTDITKGQINWATVPYCAEEPADPERYRLATGDIVISRAGSVGFSAYLSRVEPAVFASYLIRFRPVGAVNARYVAWFLKSQSYWGQISEATVGITLANVNAKKLSAVRLPLAPRAEQERIVAAIEEQLSRLDAGVAALERANENLTRLRSAVLQAAFEPHLQAGPVLPLQAVASAQLGRMLSAKRETGRHAKPYLRNRDVQWGAINTKGLPVMDFGGADAQRYRLQFGDVLVCEGGEIGRAAVWTGELGECYYQKALHRVRCSPALDPKYLRFLLEHFALTKVFDSLQSGTTIAHLPQEDVRHLPIPVPYVDEQRAAVTRIEELLAVAERASSDIRTLRARSRALHSSILAAAFTGKLVPQDPTDEPASILLERIAAERAAATPNGRKPARNSRQERLPL